MNAGSYFAVGRLERRLIANPFILNGGRPQGRSAS